MRGERGAVRGGPLPPATIVCLSSDAYHKRSYATVRLYDYRDRRATAPGMIHPAQVAVGIHQRGESEDGPAGQSLRGNAEARAFLDETRGGRAARPLRLWTAAPQCCKRPYLK